MIHITFTLIILSLVQSALAAESTGSGLKFQASGLAEMGSTYNADKTIPARNMAGGAGDVVGSWLFNSIGPAVRVNFRYFGQIDDPATKSNQNLKGYEYGLGGGIALSLMKFDFGAFYDFYSVYTESLADSSGNKDSYDTPTASFDAYLGFRINPKISIIASLEMLNYSRSLVGGNPVDVSTDKLTQVWYGLGILYHILSP